MILDSVLNAISKIFDRPLIIELHVHLIDVFRHAIFLRSRTNLLLWGFLFFLFYGFINAWVWWFCTFTLGLLINCSLSFYLCLISIDFLIQVYTFLPIENITLRPDYELISPHSSQRHGLYFTAKKRHAKLMIIILAQWGVKLFLLSTVVLIELAITVHPHSRLYLLTDFGTYQCGSLPEILAYALIKPWYSFLSELSLSETKKQGLCETILSAFSVPHGLGLLTSNGVRRTTQQGYIVL